MVAIHINNTITTKKKTAFVFRSPHRVRMQTTIIIQVQKNTAGNTQVSPTIKSSRDLPSKFCQLFGI